MLNTSWIASAKMNKDSWEYRDEWRKQRLAKFTSSMIYTLMGNKPFTEGALTYIYERVGESLTGIPAKQEVDTIATRWGLMHENTAIMKFKEHIGIQEFIVTQCLITEPGSMFGSTPDCIWIQKRFEGGDQVQTGEVKCYPSYGHFIECALCSTAQELFEVDKKLAWQVVDQMDNCNCLIGNAILYHPDFRVGGFKVIQFRKIDLIPQFKLLKERKAGAVVKFDEIRTKLMAA